MLYAALGTSMDINAMILLKTVDLHVSPAFDRPYLSTSVGDFYSRWNLTLGNSLRWLIFDPIHEGLPLPQQAA